MLEQGCVQQWGASPTLGRLLRSGEVTGAGSWESGSLGLVLYLPLTNCRALVK